MDLKLETPNQNLEIKPDQCRFKKTVLLTGAGFTKNFGGYLREEMWTSIFNDQDLQSCEPLRNHLIESLDSGDFDYERVYQSLLDDSSDEMVKDLFSQVLLEAYKKLDKVICSWNPSAGRIGGSGYHDTLVNFLSNFTGSKDEKGAIFTLNQDVFIERHYRGSLDYPSRAAACLMNDLNKSRRELSSEWIYPEKFQNHPLNTDAKIQMESCNFMYVKLHGSFNWRDGNDRPIIIAGGKKSEKIKRYPFLDWYHQLFRNALWQGDTKLLVIGYSFQDEHINSVIHDAINYHNLKLYIISPESLSRLSNRLQNGYRPTFKAVKKGLAGYYQESLIDIFPMDLRETITAKSLRDSLFS